MTDERDLRQAPDKLCPRPAGENGSSARVPCVDAALEERPQDFHPDFYAERPREDYRPVDLEDLAEETPSPAEEADLRGALDALADFEHPADLAEHIEKLSLEEQVELVRSLPLESAADALVEMEEAARTELLEQLDTSTAADLVSEMSPDDAADVLDELDESHRDQLLDHLEDEDAEEIRNLMAFAPDTAGSLMNTEIVLLDQTLTVDEAIRVLRQDIEENEIPYYAYIVDEKEHLTSVLSLRDLLISPRGTMLKDINKNRNLISVTFDQDSAEVAQMFGDYNFMALPVVDHEGHILGIITHDDVIDLINELASGDMLGMVGAGQDESVDTTAGDSVKMRLPWLMVNMVNSAVSALVVFMFDGSIAAMPMLAVLMPMVANQAGNTGQQALAVIIRQLALEKLDRRRAFKAIRREVKVSLCNGFILASLVWVGVYLLTGPKLATVMVSALVMDMFLGALAGASIPLILKRLGRDPAQASSIFLTAITDGAGFFIFLGLATIFLL